MSTATSEWVSLYDIPYLLQKKYDGKCWHAGTIRYWASRGLKGVKLKTRKVHGCIGCDISALKTFLEQTGRTALLRD